MNPYTHTRTHTETHENESSSAKGQVHSRQIQLWDWIISALCTIAYTLIIASVLGVVDDANTYSRT